MEHAAQRDLGAVLRLIGLGRVKVSARTGRASAAAAEAIAGELDGGGLSCESCRRPALSGALVCRASLQGGHHRGSGNLLRCPAKEKRQAPVCALEARLRLAAGTDFRQCRRIPASPSRPGSR